MGNTFGQFTSANGALLTLLQEPRFETLVVDDMMTFRDLDNIALCEVFTANDTHRLCFSLF